ncbi:MAG TPA: hypothetical protein VJ346_03460, partial [Bacteroidales bacterium]|nr:hypothetical protein [Bacteroidales bacterium]
MKRISYLICLTVLLATINGFAQIMSVQARLDTNEIMIGDQVSYEIEVRRNKNDVVIFPEFKKKLTDEIEIVSKSPVDSFWSKKDKKYILKQKLLLTVFDSGLYYVPPLEFLLISQHNKDTVRTTSSYLEVHPFPLDTTHTIRDIKDIEKAPVSFGEVYPYILIIIFAGLLVWFIIYYLRKKEKNQPLIGRPKIEEPPHVIALRELERLKSAKLWQRKETKLYYSQLTEIIRRYIEGRFGIMAMEQTTDEILIEFEGQEILSEEDYKILREMLCLADLVKFAKAEPLPDENETQFENACTFVNHTKYRQPEL